MSLRLHTPCNLQYFVSPRLLKPHNLRYFVSPRLLKPRDFQYFVSHRLLKPRSLRYFVSPRLLKPRNLRYFVSPRWLKLCNLHYFVSPRLLKARNLQYFGFWPCRLLGQWPSRNCVKYVVLCMLGRSRLRTAASSRLKHRKNQRKMIFWAPEDPPAGLKNLLDLPLFASPAKKRFFNPKDFLIWVRG